MAGAPRARIAGKQIVLARLEFFQVRPNFFACRIAGFGDIQPQSVQRGGQHHGEHFAVRVLDRFLRREIAVDALQSPVSAGLSLPLHVGQIGQFLQAPEDRPQGRVTQTFEG